MTIYFISGLGADKRAFQRILIPDGFKIRHMEWELPERHMTLNTYAKKFSTQIDTTEPFGIVGLSFGGIMAIELLQHVIPKHTILISSMSCRREIPALFRFAGLVRINKIAPFGLLKQPNAVASWLFGARSRDEKNLLKMILNNTSPVFLRWAIDKILNWKQKDKPANVFHIHGSKDNLLPVRNTCADLVIDGGGHLMIYTHAKLLSKIIGDKMSIHNK